ncbi:hypothetical protein IKE83_01910, partial [Candidatus Saccharibacteria bacterium]|nr:hypothetical protein [Candidatus Saccharibacteria bacterium]
DEPFFKSDTAQRYTHEIRATFKGDKLDDISYVYEATYNSPEAVESANAALHADYNTYMGENNQNQGMLEPIFANLKSKLKVSLYGNRSKLNDVTVKFFFLEPAEVQEMGKNDMDKLEKLYKEKGFSCVRSE